MLGAVSADRQAAGLHEWQAWDERHRAIIVDHGAPLGKTKAVSRTGTADVRNNPTGYVILWVAAYEEAVRWFEGHPHFTFFPGATVKIMECLPMPGM